MYDHQYVNESLISDKIRKVILNFIISLILTFGTMIVTVHTNLIFKFVSDNSFKLLSISSLFPIIFPFIINKLKWNLSKSLFYLYSILIGLILSYAFIKYGISIMIFSLLCTIAIFVVMALFGYFTREDLERYRVLLKIALFFLITTFLINLYFGVYILHWIIGYWSIGIFISFIGYDMYHIKNQLIDIIKQKRIEFNQVTILGSFQFYFDFLILGLAIMSIFGKIFV